MVVKFYADGFDEFVNKNCLDDIKNNVITYIHSYDIKDDLYLFDQLNNYLIKLYEETNDNKLKQICDLYNIISNYTNKKLLFHVNKYLKEINIDIYFDDCYDIYTPKEIMSFILRHFTIILEFYNLDGFAIYYNIYDCNHGSYFSLNDIRKIYHLFDKIKNDENIQNADFKSNYYLFKYANDNNKIIDLI
jgi:hypothetical protein